MLLNSENREVIATAFGKGRTHDFRLFKESCTHLHPHTCVPVKASKHHPLTHEKQRANRVLARRRLRVEQVIGKLKVFRILGERYRGRRKRFGLRFNLIAGVHNFELGLGA